MNVNVEGRRILADFFDEVSRHRDATIKIIRNRNWGTNYCIEKEDYYRAILTSRSSVNVRPIRGSDVRNREIEADLLLP